MARTITVEFTISDLSMVLHALREKHDRIVGQSVQEGKTRAGDALLRRAAEFKLVADKILASPREAA